jgi:hypothetical protein
MPAEIESATRVASGDVEDPPRDPRAERAAERVRKMQHPEEVREHAYQKP